MQNKNTAQITEHQLPHYEVATQRTPEQLLGELSHDERLAELLHDIDHARVNAGQIDAADRSYEAGDVLGMQKSMASVFSFRKIGGERNEREDMPKVELFSDRVEALAHEYGFTGDTIPESPDATAAIILGGRATGSYDRTRYMKELIHNGHVDTDTIVLLGSTRPADALDKNAAEIFEDATDEFGIMKIAAKDVFGAVFEEVDELQGHDGNVATGFEQGWRIAHSKTEDGKNLFVLSAPQLTDNFHGDGNRRGRTNTSDTLNMFAKVADLEPGAHVIIDTNAHFGPFQGADAVGNLDKYGVTAETVGFSPEHYNRPAKTPEELVQEIFSAVNSSIKAEKGSSEFVQAEIDKELAERSRLREENEFTIFTDDIDNDTYNLEVHEFNKRIDALKERLAKIALLNA